MTSKRLSLAALSAVLGACTMAPKYHRPAAPVTAGWPTGPAYQEISTSTGAPSALELRWRDFFNDEKLRQVIDAALKNNRDLRLAALNVELARAQYGIQRAALFPAVNAVGEVSREKEPAAFFGASGAPITITQDQVSLGLSWEIDFFGRLRSLKAQALQEYLATEQARRSAQILLVSSVANAYLTLAADLENLALSQTTLVNQRDAYNLTKRRNELGLVPDLDLYRAQTQVDTARGDAARFVQLAAQDKNALDLLLGVPAPEGLLPTDLSGVAPPKEISAGLSSEVLLRRPDVLQAEGLLKAAHAEIGAARAAMFPIISLTGALGTASGDLSGLFKPGSGAWSYAPQVAMPIFDARTWSALKVTKVQREIAVAQYEKAIQSAFRDVADALAVRGTVDQQVEAQQSLVDADSQTYRLSKSRYDKGIDNYLSVLDAQRSLYAAQQGLVSLRLAKLANSVQLYAALGGGWQPEPPRAAAAPAPAQQSEFQ
jgi:multidrug efflux system outer membrane protein